MWKEGVIDANVAMQLLGREVNAAASDAPAESLGSAAGTATKKRPRENSVDSNPPRDGNPEESLDDVLEQAKKAKQDTFLIYWL